MGQYYALYNVEQHACIDAMSFGSGLKLTESCYVDNPFVNGVSELLAGPWYGDRVMFVGDYAWDGAMGWKRGDGPRGSAWEALLDLEAAGVVASDPYLADEYLDSIEPSIADSLVERAKSGNPELRYVANLDKRVYYDRGEMPAAWEYKAEETGEQVIVRQDALLLFLAVGSRDSGGDYPLAGKGADLLGSWAADRIAVLAEPPEGFEKIASPFDGEA